MSNDPVPDLALFRSFLAVAETRNLSAAGAALGLAQPTVSQHIQRLEAALGVPLFERDTRPLGLTLAAETLLRELPGKIAEIESVLARVRAAREGPREVLRVAMPDSLSCILGAEFLAGSGKLARTLELRSGISPWIENSFRARHFDLAIDSPPFDPATRAAHIALFSDPYVIVTPRAMAGLPLERVVREKPRVSFGRNSKFGAATAEIASELGTTMPPRFSFDSTQSLLRFVQTGYGWAAISAFCLLQSPRTLRDLDVHPCRPNQKRTFFLLGSPDESPALLADAASGLTTVFQKLLDGPWASIAPSIAGMIRAANREDRPAVAETVAADPANAIILDRDPKA